MKPDNVSADEVLQAALDKLPRLIGANWWWSVRDPKARVGRGKNYLAEQWALIISSLRGHLLWEFEDSLDPLEWALDAFSLPGVDHMKILYQAHKLADLILEIAMRSPTAFRMIGEALEKAEKSGETHKLIT